MSTDLSIVVPARQEGARLEETIGRVMSYLDHRASGDLVLAVDHGSTDDTASIAGRAANADRRITHVAVERRGKGFAIMRGVEVAGGEVVLIADADLSVDPSQFEVLYASASKGELAIGTRSGPGAERIGEPATRFLLGRLFNLVVRIAVLPGISDSQCGFKAFPREAGLALLRRVQAGGWAFDVELLALARREGLPIREVPVVWRYGHQSTLRPVGDAPGVVDELWGIRRRVGRVRAPSDGA